MIERAAITARDGILNIEGALALPGPQPARNAALENHYHYVLPDSEIRDMERANVLRALDAAQWRIAGPSGAARLLGIPPSTLTSRMKSLGIARAGTGHGFSQAV